MMRRLTHRGMTLVELLVGLSILAMVSTAVVGMLRAGGEVNSAIQNSVSTQWEMETAICRMIQQARLCTSFTVPSSTSIGNTFSIVTEPDAMDQTYAVTYSLVTAADGTSQLQEVDPRYGTSVLVHNVASFAVSLKSTATPQVLVMAITAGQSPPVLRTFRITPRNQ